MERWCAIRCLVLLCPASTQSSLMNSAAPFVLVSSIISHHQCCSNITGCDSSVLTVHCACVCVYRQWQWLVSVVGVDPLLCLLWTRGAEKGTIVQWRHAVLCRSLSSNAELYDNEVRSEGWGISVHIKSVFLCVCQKTFSTIIEPLLSSWGAEVTRATVRKHGTWRDHWEWTRSYPGSIKHED